MPIACCRSSHLFGVRTLVRVCWHSSTAVRHPSCADPPFGGRRPARTGPCPDWGEAARESRRAAWTGDSPPSNQVYVFPASHAQRGLWFLDQLAPGSSLYNHHTSSALRSPVDAADSGSQRQRDRPPSRVPAHGLPLGRRRTGAGRRAEASRPDATHRPPRRAPGGARGRRGGDRRGAGVPDRSTSRSGRSCARRWSRLDDDHHVLLLTMHHIVCDFWSLEIFQEELVAIYAAFSAGRPSPLPEVAIQYADVSEWEREWLAGPEGPVASRLLETPACRPAGAPAPDGPSAAGGADVRRDRLRLRSPA